MMAETAMEVPPKAHLGKDDDDNNGGPSHPEGQHPPQNDTTGVVSVSMALGPLHTRAQVVLPSTQEETGHLTAGTDSSAQADDIHSKRPLDNTQDPDDTGNDPSTKRLKTVVDTQQPKEQVFSTSTSTATCNNNDNSNTPQILNTTTPARPLEASQIAIAQDDMDAQHEQVQEAQERKHNHPPTMIPQVTTEPSNANTIDRSTETTILAAPQNSNSEEDVLVPAPSTTGQAVFGENDVLSGRGGGTNVHPGNRHFRDLIHLHRRGYLAARKNDKPAISRRIVKTIRDAGGRFLRKCEKTQLWFEIGDDAAREKTSQALRQRAPEMRKMLCVGSSSSSSSDGVSLMQQQGMVMFPPQQQPMPYGMFPPGMVIPAGTMMVNPPPIMANPAAFWVNNNNNNNIKNNNNNGQGAPTSWGMPMPMMMGANNPPPYDQSNNGGGSVPQGSPQEQQLGASGNSPPPPAQQFAPLSSLNSGVDDPSQKTKI